MGSKPSPPPIPNPRQVAGEQSAGDVRTAVANAWLNNIDQVTPFGQIKYSLDSENPYRIMNIPIGNGKGMQSVKIPIFKSEQILSGNQQQLLDNQEKIGIALGDLGLSQAHRLDDVLNTPFDPSSLLPERPTSLPDINDPNSELQRQRVEDALWARLNPQVDRDRSALESKLINQGIGQNSKAWNNAFSAFDQNVNDQRNQVVLSGAQEQQRLFNDAMQRAQGQNALRQGAFQEAVATRNQPISEISALLSQSQPTVPQFQPWNGPDIPSPPIAQSYYNSAALANQQYLSQMQQANAGLGGMYGLGSTLLGGLFAFSDRRLKSDIEAVGKLDNGLTVYRYRMMGGPVQLGVMADEVEKVIPDAVVNVGMFKAVDYVRATEAV